MALAPAAPPTAPGTGGKQEATWSGGVEDGHRFHGPRKMCSWMCHHVKPTRMWEVVYVCHYKVAGDRSR